LVHYISGSALDGGNMQVGSGGIAECTHKWRTPIAGSSRNTSLHACASPININIVRTQFCKAGDGLVSTNFEKTIPRVIPAWVQHWVQLKQEKWLRFSCKRHQTRHLDFPPRPLLTEGLEVRIFPREPNFLFTIFRK
jgi:hypothetical protein